MDVRLPDGRVVTNVPEGMTQAELLARVNPKPQPVTIGKDGFSDALREVLGEQSWLGRNLAGAGTAASNVYQGVKQMLGKGDDQAIEANRVMAQEAPVGALAGNVAMLAPTAMIPGANTVAGAGVIGAASGLVQPTQGDESRLQNTLVGGALGAGGQYLGNKAGEALQTALQKRIAEKAAEQSRNAVRDATLKAGQDAGYTLPRSAVEPSFLSNRLESLGGKAAIGQEAASRNQEVTNKLARAAVGLPDDAPLTSVTLAKLRQQAGQPYAEVAALPTPTNPAVLADDLERALLEKTASKQGALQDVGRFATTQAQQDVASTKWYPVEGLPRAPARYSPHAERATEALGAYSDALSIAAQRQKEVDFLRNQLGSLRENIASTKPVTEFAYRSPAENVEALKVARNEAQTLFQHYNRSADPISLAKAKEARSLAETLEQALEEQAKAGGNAGLVDKLRDARRTIAKTYDIERAVNEGTGDISAPVLGRLLDKGRPLSGELETIAKFNKAFPQYTREGAKLPTAGVSKSEALAAALLGVGGAATAGPMGMAAAALPLMSGPARHLALSRVLQSAPSYAPSLTQKALKNLTPERAAILARTLALSAQ